MRKEASAYLLNDRVFVHAKKRTIKTVPIFSEPLYELSLSDPPVTMGNKIKECIEAFSEGHDHPSREDFKKTNDPTIRLAGEKTPKAFFTKVKYVPITLMGDKIIFYPSVNKGWKDGFANTEHPNIELDYSIATNEDLGKALLRAFELSIIL